MTDIKRISIVGLGWLGLPLAFELSRRGYNVQGSTTTSEKQALLQNQGINVCQLSLNPQPEGDLEALLDADLLIVNVPPKAGKFGDDFHPAQMQALAEAVQHSAVRWVIYVSSTSVYPESSRTMVETDVQHPGESAAPALVQAEQIWQTLQTDARQVTILRCGGLMGYERIPGKYVAGRTVDSGAVPVNYLHRDDAVGLIAAVIDQGLTGIFNLVAPEHPTREAIYRRSCADFDYTLPVFVEPAEPVPFKIISPEKVIKKSGYTFVYPDPLNFYYSQS